MWRAKDPVKQRTATVHALLRRPPSEPGQFLYSNFGYLVAGAMIEKVTGQSWEALLRQRLFQPLQMSSCGFGAPASPDRIDQPWGHRTTTAGLTPVPPGPQADNPPSLGPAGTVHCDLRDWARFAQLHLDGGRGRSTRLTTASFARLHIPPVTNNSYAMGWHAMPQRSGGLAMTHDGSNTMFFARAWLLPVKDFAFLVVTNAAGHDAENAIDRMAFYLRARHLK
jgi:CubicO group peptidase (beta-lactamase class C family)